MRITGIYTDTGYHSFRWGAEVERFTENGQMAAVPWLRVRYRNGTCEEFNLAHVHRICWAPPSEEKSER